MRNAIIIKGGDIWHGDIQKVMNCIKTISWSWYICEVKRNSSIIFVNWWCVYKVVNFLVL